MNKEITTHAKQDFEFHLHLTMGEAAVLSGLFAYGHEPLMKASLAMGSAIKESVGDPAPAMKSLSDKIRGPLQSEWERCMELRRVFHNPALYAISRMSTKEATP